MNITKITIGRLFNLGSYEHARYELSVEVPPGESAATALTGLERIIEALNPRRPCNVPSEEETKHAANRIGAMRAMSPEDFERQYLGYGSKATQASYIASSEQDLADGIKRREEWQARAKRARELLDDLGGAAVWKDAKQDWDTED
jgi:putative NADH-flavin reductase